MTPHELARPVPDGIAPGGNRQTALIPADVVDEGPCRRIPARRVFLQRLHDDRVEIAPQLASQATSVGPACPGNRLRRDVAVRARLAASNDRRGTRDVTFGDRALDLSGRHPGQLVRSTPRQELVGERSQGVHIGRRRHGLTANLLGRGVLGRHRSAAETGERRVGAGPVLRCLLMEDLGDTEVEQLDLSVGRHHRVRGLQVAMHDEILVRILNGVAHRGEQERAGAGRRASFDRSTS